MKGKTSNIDKEYLRRSRRSTPTERLQWLGAAWEFAQKSKKNTKKKKTGNR